MNDKSLMIASAIVGCVVIAGLAISQSGAQDDTHGGNVSPGMPFLIPSSRDMFTIDGEFRMYGKLIVMQRKDLPMPNTRLNGLWRYGDYGMKCLVADRPQWKTAVNGGQYVIEVSEYYNCLPMYW